MIKISIYSDRPLSFMSSGKKFKLPNGKAINAYLKRRQFLSLIGQIKEKLPLKKRIKKWLGWPWFKSKSKQRAGDK